ncbi:hypothetical protein [Escherichia coli]|nr:hypothetical protein [Escherichia coli]
MKKFTVALSAVAASVLMAMPASAAEIYNKDGNIFILQPLIQKPRT